MRPMSLTMAHSCSIFGNLARVVATCERRIQVLDAMDDGRNPFSRRHTYFDAPRGWVKPA